MGAEFYFTEGTLTDGAPNTIIAENDFSLASCAHVKFEL
jgi:hypothetical protein